MEKLKKIFNKLKKNKYFKIAVIALGVIILALLIYRFFISNIVIFKQNEDKFLEGVKRYYDYDPTKLPKDGNYKEVSLLDMYEGAWVETLYVPNSTRLCSEESYVRTIAEEGTYRYVVYLKCGNRESNVDHEAPEIVLNGDSSIISPLNLEYQDLGVKQVNDNSGRIDVAKVKIDTSAVDVKTTGSYEVTYTVYDNNFNRAKTTRKVVVVETLGARIQREKGENYRYAGDVKDNYVLFSGMMFRIVKSGENVTLITDNTISNVAYSLSEVDYKESNIYKWLNNYFLSNINENSKKYIVDTTWCYDDMTSSTSQETCNNKTEAKVGLLSLSDYEKSKVNNRSYLIDASRFYMLNKKDSKNMWITNLYNTNALETMSITSLVGVRPVINIDGDIYLTGGSGTYDDPYKLQDYTYAKENDKLNSRIIGEYVMYSGYNFRVAGVDKNGNTKLVCTELLYNSSNDRSVGIYYDTDVIEKITPKVEQEGNLYYALRYDALNYLSEKEIVESEFEIPTLDMQSDYDKLKTTKITSKIGLPASYEMFSGLNKLSTSGVIYWLSDYNEDNKVTIINGNNGIAFYLNVDTFTSNAVKPVIYLNSDLKIASGKGSASNPYYVR